MVTVRQRAVTGSVTLASSCGLLPEKKALEEERYGGDMPELQAASQGVGRGQHRLILPMVSP